MNVSIKTIREMLRNVSADARIAAAFAADAEAAAQRSDPDLVQAISAAADALHNALHSANEALNAMLAMKAIA